MFLRTPMFADYFVIGANRLLLLNDAKDFDNGPAAIKRFDERLLNGNGSVERTKIAP